MEFQAQTGKVRIQSGNNQGNFGSGKNASTGETETRMTVAHKIRFPAAEALIYRKDAGSSLSIMDAGQTGRGDHGEKRTAITTVIISVFVIFKFEESCSE